MNTPRIYWFMSLALAVAALFLGFEQIHAQKIPPGQTRKQFQEERKAAADNFQATFEAAMAEGMEMEMDMPDPGGIPHYFGPWANWAYTRLPRGAVSEIELENGGSGYTAPEIVIKDLYATGMNATAIATVTDGVITGIDIGNGGSGYSAPLIYITDPTGTGAEARAIIGPPFDEGTGIRKFVDSLPGLGPGNANNLGQYLPIAVPDKTTYPGSDYYEIALVEYEEQMHSDLPPTLLRGYVQEKDGVPLDAPHYMGPVIVAERDIPVRVKFTNRLPTGIFGNLFIPVDTTIMGSGRGPDAGGMHEMDPLNPMCTVMNEVKPAGCYSENRATVHLHGNNTVWISDGTPHQWITPAWESTNYPEGVSVVNVPDMDDPGDGSMTFYYTNAHSARLMFYHDHAYGITRLNVLVGQAAAYVLTDDVEKDMIAGTNETGVNPDNLQVLPDIGIPLVIQDKTFVDADTIGAQDPTWNWGSMPGMFVTGDLWYPHVYMPVQNPWDESGWNTFGRWQYGPWFWPPTVNVTPGPVENPYYDCYEGGPCESPWEPPMNPGVPNVSMGMETFFDTPVVNGTAYPYMEVEPKAYRFRILNAANDRFFNLQLYQAYDPDTDTVGVGTEVKMVPADSGTGLPMGWPADGREGGLPDPATAGPAMIQIGTEGGFLPAPVLLPNQPIGWNLDVTTFDAGNVEQGTLILGTAERADVIIDFSNFEGDTLILYNDAPAPWPAGDPLFDYYTGNPLDLTDNGGSPTTQAGYGPNIRTIMQFRVTKPLTAPTPEVNLENLEAVFAKTTGKSGVFEVSQDTIIIPDARYNSAYDASFPAQQNVNIFEYFKTFNPVAVNEDGTYGVGNPVTVFFEAKAIQDEMGETFDEYGRMSGMLGLQLANNAPNQVFVTYPFPSPPVEILQGMNVDDLDAIPIGALEDGTQIWKITHNGVDTHTIHVHLFNAQIINRVAWDNSIRPPDANELGWKETFRVNPLQDTILAFRPVIPDVPFLDEIPNSVRLIDPTLPEGAPLMGAPFGFFDPDGNPTIDINGTEGSILNHYVNYGWEYVYHCHLLSHEEMDMMHAVVLAVPPAAPTGLAAEVIGNGNNRRVALSWLDNSLNETEFIVQRSAYAEGPWEALATLPADSTAYSDPIGNTNQAFFYRVYASNTVGDTETSGFPVMIRDSAYSEVASVGSVQADPPQAPTNMTATIQAGPQVLLSWSDNANNETGFVIERQTGTGAFAALVTVGPRNGTGSVSYTDTAVTAGATYTYRVAAVNSAGLSGYATSNTITIASPPAAPSPVTATAAVQGRNNARVTLNWTNVANETGYTIQRATNATFTANLVSNTVGADVTSFTTGNVARSTPFYFRVQAYNGAGASAWVNANPFPIITP